VVSRLARKHLQQGTSWQSKAVLPQHQGLQLRLAQGRPDSYPWSLRTEAAMGSALRTAPVTSPQRDGDGPAPTARGEPCLVPGLEQGAPCGLPVRCQTSAAPAAPRPWGVQAPAPVPQPRLLDAARAGAKRPITLRSIPG